MRGQNDIVEIAGLSISELQTKANERKEIHETISGKIQSRPGESVDRFIHDQHRDLFSSIDCMNCANCCKTTPALVKQEDMDRIANHMSIPVGEFIERFLIMDEDGDFVTNVQPCPFLEKNNACKIYEVRPEACREFPLTLRKDQKSTASIMVDNAAICPAVFRIFERLESWLGLKLILIFLLTASTAFQSQAQFVERALEVGVDHENSEFTMIGGGVAIFDLNNDQKLDLFFTGGLLVDALYINNGNGFDRIINYLEPEDFDFYEWTASAVAAGDLNNDGWDDLVICTYKEHQNIILLNNGDNTFDALPPDSSNITDTTWCLGASLGDINKDGLLDIFFVNYIEVPGASYDPNTGETDYFHEGFKNHLYINRGDGVFADRSAHFGVDVAGNTLACAFTDYDQDGDVDLYVVNDFGHFVLPNELYRNEYPSDAFTDVSESSRADVGLFGMGVAIGDYDADLDLDYYLTNLGKNILLNNDGLGGFDDMTDVAMVGDSATVGGLAVGWGTGFFDYDNDGDVDLYVANGYVPATLTFENDEFNANAFFQNEGNGTFTDVRAALNFTDSSVCRGSAVGDLDNDGLLDVVMVVTNRGPDPPDEDLLRRAAIFYNETPTNNHYIRFHLIGDSSNTSGYGAHIYLYPTNGLVQLREADGGSSHASANSPYIHFGLGPETGVDSVVIHWPSGIRQRLLAPAADMMHTVQEGEDQVISNVHSQDHQKLKLHPVPARDRLHVALEFDILEGTDPFYLSVADVHGKTCIEMQLVSASFDLDIAHLIPGSYIVRVWTAERAALERLFVKVE